MIEAFFHTEILLQRAFRALAEDGDGTPVTVFVAKRRDVTEKDKQWHLRPGIKPELVAGREPEGDRSPKTTIRDRSIGIEVIDAGESRNIQGSSLVYVSVNIAIRGSTGEVWMDVKRYSNYVSRMGSYLNPKTALNLGKGTGVTLPDFESHCDIKPSAYGLSSKDVQPSIISGLKPYGIEEIYLDEETFNITYARRQFEMSLAFFREKLIE